MAGEENNSDVTTGEYVDQPQYRLMRLRMLLTGTASPTDDDWAKILGDLLLFLQNSHEGKCFVADSHRRLAKRARTAKS